MDSQGTTFYNTLVRSCEVILTAIRTYSHKAEVLLELLGDLVGEFTARDLLAIPSPVQCMNLPPCYQHAVA